MDDTTRPLDPPRADAGRVIGPYRLLTRLGEGGMGEVFLAQQDHPVSRKLAIKVIKSGINTRQVVARFEAERQALALMEHPCIAKVYDAGETPDGLPYLAMEYVQGEPVTTYCDRHKLSTRDRLALVMEICDAVQHAHHKGVIHRDLKPGNILVTVDGGKPLPKVIDFGVAKAIGMRLTERTMFTELGVLVGTPEYMSPEQAEMTGLDVDTRTDVYALGVLLYELLSGSLPFDSRELRAGGFDEIRRRIREEDPPHPSVRVKTLGERSVQAAACRRTDPGKLAGELRHELDWIVMKTLEKDRTRRYGSPGELRADVERFLRNEPVLAGPPGILYRARKFARRHRFGVGVSVAAIVAVVAFAFMAVIQTRGVSRERDRAERVSEFLIQLFQRSDPRQALGETTTVREILDEGARRIEEELRDEPLVRAKLMDTMAQVYWQLGLFEKAETLYTATLETHRQELGEEAEQTLDSKNMLGYIWYRQGRLPEAEQIVTGARDARIRLQGAESEGSLWSTSTLTLILTGLGKYEEAIHGQSAALEVWVRNSGWENRGTLIAAANLGLAYNMSGDRKKAEELYEKVLRYRRDLYGVEHPETLRIMQQRADILRSQGRFEEAEQLNREALEARRRVLGPAHSETAHSMTAVALDLEAQERYAEAEKLHTEAIAIQRQAIGPEHPETLWAMHLRADSSWRQDRMEEAVQLHEEVWEIRERVLGPGHLDTQRSCLTLASLQAVMGNRRPALAWIQRAVESGFRGVEWLVQDETFVSLREDPEFQRLLTLAGG